MAWWDGGRESIMDSLAKKRAEIQAGTGPGQTLGSLAGQRAGVLGNLAKTREEILANTGGQATRESLANTRSSILGNLASEREGVFKSVREGGDGGFSHATGPVMIPRDVGADYSEAMTLEVQANRETDPNRKAYYTQLAALARQRAEQRQAAQNIVQGQTLKEGWSPYSSAGVEGAKMTRDRQNTLADQNQQTMINLLKSRYGQY